MASVDDHLRHWREAGLLDSTVEHRIRAFEAAQAEAGGERPGIVEALIYLGIAIVAAGVLILAITTWDELESWARIAAPAVPGGLALLAGETMRRSTEPGVRRGGQMAWLAGVALLTTAATITGSESDWEGRNTALFSGLVAAALGVGLWALAPSHPQILGLAGGLFTLGIGLGAQPDDYSIRIAGVAMVLFGAAQASLVEADVLRPKVSAGVLAGLSVGLGSLFVGIGEPERLWGEILPFVTGGGLVALSIWRGSFVHIVFGVATVFAGLLTLILRRVEDETTAALALMLVGAGLIATVLILARLRPWAPSKRVP